MSGTHSTRPNTSGIPRRPVTAVDFGNAGGSSESPVKASISVRSKATIETVDIDDDDWFPEHNEASVCLVIGSDDDNGEDEQVQRRKLARIHYGIW